MKKVIAVVFAVIMLAAAIFTGPVMAAEEEDLTGEWYIQSLQEGAVVMDYAFLSALGANMVLTLNEDGTARMESAGSVQEGTWSAEEGIIHFETDCPFSLEDGKLTIQYDTQTALFGREEAGNESALASVVTDAEAGDFEGKWKAATYSGLGMTLPLSALGIEITLNIAEGKAAVREVFMDTSEEGKVTDTVELEFDVEMKENGVLYVDFNGQDVLGRLNLTADGIDMTLLEDGKLRGTIPETTGLSDLIDGMADMAEGMAGAIEVTEDAAEDAKEKPAVDTGDSDNGSSGGESMDTYILFEKAE